MGSERMNILGIVDGQHDAGASLVQDGKTIAALGEERLSRIKLDGGFPKKAIKEVLKIAKLKPEDVDAIAVAGFLTPPLFVRYARFIQKKEEDVRSQKESKIMKFLSDTVIYRLKLTIIKPSTRIGKLMAKRAEKAIRYNLPKSLKNKTIVVFEHHLCHVTSAYFTSGLKEALCVTADCWGDGLSLTINICKNNNIRRIYSIDARDSFGHFYGAITKYLGFKPYRHEGKILGLSAHGDPKKVKIPFPFKLKNGKFVFTDKFSLDLGQGLRKKLSKYSREDISAWLQKNMKRLITDLVKHFVKKTKQKHILLDGGVFSNVRFNQSIQEIPGVKSVYIYPNMGDGGLASGAALYLYSRLNPKNNFKRLENVYYGPEYSDSEIENELIKQNVDYKKYNDVEKEIAKLLSKGNVVARFNGRMEYGPRALGNRSILYQTTDPTVNDWLNKKLNRTEFMPFAPATLAEHKDKCYKNMTGANFAAYFMTITFDCTDFMKKNSPATVHVDGTARPQIVDNKMNSSFYKIIKEYHKLTKIPSIINTSFNMHEEPIVCSPYDAVRAFKLGHLEYLAIGNFIAKNNTEI